MAKALASVLVLLLVSSFTVFAKELETLPPTYPPHPPTKSPSYPPVNPPYSHHHHHHHPHSPAPAPVKPPTHQHYPPRPSPPTPVPAKPPTHQHYPPPPPPPPAPVAKPPTHQPYPPPTPVHPPPLHPIPRSFIAVQGVVFVKSCKYAGIDTLLGATPLLGAVVKLQCNNTKYKWVQTAKTDKNGYFFIQASKNITTYAAHKCNVVLVSAITGLKPSNLHGGVTGAVLRPEKPFVSQGLPFMLYTVGPLAFEPKCPL